MRPSQPWPPRPSISALRAPIPSMAAVCWVPDCASSWRRRDIWKRGRNKLNPCPGRNRRSRSSLLLKVADRPRRETGVRPMKTHRFLTSVAVASVLASAAPAYAQVLGGGLGGAANGAVGGALSGGMGGVSGMANGAGSGSVTGSLGGQTDAIDRIGQRAKGTAAGTADRAHDTAGKAHDKTQSAGTTGRDKAASTL